MAGRIIKWYIADVKVSIVTPNFNGARFLEETLASVIAQRDSGVELEYIVIDGASSDDSMAVVDRHRGGIDIAVSEPDHGPASAINKGLRLATGDLMGWLNSDDLYHPGALARSVRAMASSPRAALCFGRCRIVDEGNREIRRFVTGFKESLFPFASRPLIQTVNYISQPAMFFRRAAFEKAGFLREDLHAAFDYEFILRLWRQGGACRIQGPPVADFRWHAQSISASRFRDQFREEYEIARADAGRFAPQTWLHWIVRWGIVAAYKAMRPGREG